MYPCQLLTDLEMVGSQHPAWVIWFPCLQSSRLEIDVGPARRGALHWSHMACREWAARNG
jgi:hypothetical protein